MYTATVGATQGLNTYLRSVYGWSEATAYQHIGISGMNGLSDQQELTTPDTWTRIRDWAQSKDLARLTFWSVNRDRGCAGDGVQSGRSGSAQPYWELPRLISGS